MASLCQIKRAKMVATQLEKRGIRGRRLLKAFGKVPRHEFVPERLQGQAYSDAALPLSEEQTISQPYMAAIMTQSAEVKRGARILEIGTGSGYQSAILAEMGADVYTVERIRVLSEQAAETLEKLGYRAVHSKVADGTLGWKEKAPFDAILVAAGGPKVPRPLVAQLAAGGRLVIPLGKDRAQGLYVVTEGARGISKRLIVKCAFVPLIGEHGWDGEKRGQGEPQA